MRSIKFTIALVAALQLTNCADSTLENISPFYYGVHHIDFGYAINASIEGGIYDEFNGFFESRGYSGNGYTWRGIIENIINEETPELARHITYDEEAGFFCMYVDSEANRNRVLHVIVPYFSDQDKLGSYLETIDRSSIDD